MAVAADVLAAVAPGERPPESVREDPVAPRAVRGLGQGRRRRGPGPELRAGMEQGGRLAVIAPGARIAELARAMPEAVPGDQAEVLDSPVALLTVGQSKGLEFDRVVLVDPAGILAQSPAGGHDLYVAITRATHRLTVVHDGDLPPSLHRLASSTRHDAPFPRVPLPPRVLMHEVLRVLVARARAGSQPGCRDDGFRVALAIEGAGCGARSRPAWPSRSMNSAGACLRRRLWCLGRGHLRRLAARPAGGPARLD